MYSSTAHLSDKCTNVLSSDYQCSLMTLINRNVHWSLMKDTEGGSYQRNLTADTLCIIKAITLGLQPAGRPSFCIRWGMSETLAAFRRTEGSWLYPVETVVESYLPQRSHNLGRMKTGLSNLVPRQVITTTKKERDKHEEENILKHQQCSQQPGAAVGMVTVPLCFQTIN